MKKQSRVLQKPMNRQQNAKLINRNILNKSSSKQLPFFTKAQRFPSVKPSIQHSQKSKSQSNHSTSKSHKFPTIPKAQRILYFDQQKQLCLNPSPQAYHVRSRDQICKITHKGNTMGIRFNSLANIRQNTPSASDYQNNNIIIKKSFNKSFTFDRSQRTLLKILKKQGNDSPGPKYNISKSPQEKHSLHFHFKPRAKKIRMKSNRAKLLSIAQNRLSNINLEIQQNNKRQQNFHVINKTQKARNIKKNVGFSTTQRVRIKTLPQNPGPGSYIFFSQFSGWN